MKKLNILLIILFYMSVLSAQQSGEVIYKVKQDKSYFKSEYYDNINKKLGGDMAKRMTKMVDKNYQIAQDFDFILKFNATQSLYYWDESMPDETVDKFTYDGAAGLGGGKSIYYRGVKKKLFFTQENIFGDYKRVKLPYKPKWKITKETDTILGYPVIKAVDGEIMVWFAPDIPVPYGPIRYGGLPGLILKFQYHNRVILAEKIKLFKKAIAIKMPDKGEFTTESAVLKAYREADAKRHGGKFVTQ